MQTYSQTFTGASTWPMNVRGRYFVVIDAGAPVNIRLYRNGTMLDLGEIKAIGAGIEVQLPEGQWFDQVQIDATAADTITIGVGNGDARYNARIGVPVQYANVTVSNVVVGTAQTLLLNANAARKFVSLRNSNASSGIYLRLGGSTIASVLIPPGGLYEMTGAAVYTGVIRAIADTGGTGCIVTEGY